MLSTDEASGELAYRYEFISRMRYQEDEQSRVTSRQFMVCSSETQALPKQETRVPYNSSPCASAALAHTPPNSIMSPSVVCFGMGARCMGSCSSTMIGDGVPLRGKISGVCVYVWCEEQVFGCFWLRETDAECCEEKYNVVTLGIGDFTKRWV